MRNNMCSVRSFFVVKKIIKIIGNIFISKNYEVYKYNL